MIHFSRYCIILLELLYQMLKESHPFRKKKLICLSCNSGQPLLTLATTITHHFPKLQGIDHTQGVELTEKVCAVMYELLGVVEQARWPQTQRTNVSVSWLVESLLGKEKVSWP